MKWRGGGGGGGGVRGKLCVKGTRGSWEAGVERGLELGFQNRWEN